MDTVIELASSTGSGYGAAAAGTWSTPTGSTQKRDRKTIAQVQGEAHE
jgi:hypothetical protein